MPSKHDVFISYSTKDKDKANETRNLLEGMGVSCWMAPHDIEHGDDYNTAIPPAIDNAKMLVVLLSPNADASKWVKREVTRADNKNVRICPIVIEDVSLRQMEMVLQDYQMQFVSQTPLEVILRHLATMVDRKSDDGESIIEPGDEEVEVIDLVPAVASAKIVDVIMARGPKKSRIFDAVRAGATDTEVTDNKGRTALHYSVENFETDSDVLALLLERGANVNARDKNGVTPLHLAVADVDLARLIILKGADFEARDKTDQTPLSYASEQKVTQTILLLDVCAALKSGNKTPVEAMEEAFTFLRKQSDRILNVIAVGAGIMGDANLVSLRDTFGRTALHWAAQENEPELVELLLNQGADAGALDEKNQTPARLAQLKGNSGVVELLRVWQKETPPTTKEVKPPEEVTFKYDVFLSYSSKNELFADNVFNALKASGLRVWMDRESIPGGAKWEQGITEALDNSRMMLVIVSQASMASKWVGRETLVADELDKRILPVKIEEPSTRIPLCLREVQELNLVGNQSRSMVNRIVSATEEMLSSLESEQAPPDEFVTEAPLPASVANEGFKQARATWVDGQLDYFKGKFPQDREYLTALRNWSWALVAFGLVASAVLAWAQVTADGSSTAAGARFGGFVTTFASANALTSPLVPGVLSLIHMLAWPVVTEQNSRGQSSAPPAAKYRLQEMRRWFIRESAAWRLASVAGVLAILALVAEFYVGLSLSATQASLLQVVATLCFFLPALIFAHAQFKALPEHVRLYEPMYRIFDGAKTLLNEVAASPYFTEDKKVAKERRIYRELGREALRADGEWLLLHRDRPLDIEA